MTTSSDELISSLARPREGIAEVMDCSVDDIVDDVLQCVQWRFEGEKGMRLVHISADRLKVKRVAGLSCVFQYSIYFLCSYP